MNKNIITKTPIEFEIRFPYNPNLVQQIRNITNRRYIDDKADRHWTVPLSSEDEVLKFGTQYGFDFVFGEAAPKAHGYDFSDLSIPDMPEFNVPYQFKKPLYDYQLKGVAYILEKKRVIVGDTMGLGKTAQSIIGISAADQFPCLIICPATLRENWRREWQKWTDKKAVVLSDSIKNRWQMYADMKMADVFIVNYESLKKYFVKDIKKSEKLSLSDITFNESIAKFRSVIIDESHRCKSGRTLQTKLTNGICKDKEYVLALTGTPVVNKPEDLISQLQIINQLDAIGGYMRFKRMYCDEKFNGALEHLNAQLRRICFYRREKHDVLTELPSKTRQVVYCDIDNRKEYSAAEEDLADYLRKYRERTEEQIETSLRGEIMVKMGALKNISARGKLDTVFEFIDDVMSSGEKLVVFAHLNEVLDKVQSRYPGCVSVRGSDTMPERQRSIDMFQNDPHCKLIVCSIQAAGVGITLTASSRVAFIEFAWHPAIHDQCEDRCHRIGAKDNVQCTYFAGRNTIDEDIYKLIEEKREMSKSAIGAVDVTEISIIDDVMTLFDINNLSSNRTEQSDVPSQNTLF